MPDMRLPKRRAQLLNPHQDKEDVLWMTQEGIDHLKRQLKDLESQKPQAVEAMAFALSLGDFSENAEYQDAKARLARLHSRIFSINDRLRRAKPVASTGSDIVQMGSTVTVRVNNKEKTFRIVSGHEANPSQGRVSSVSPVGGALIGKSVDEEVTIKTEQGTTIYTIIAIK